MTTITPYLWFDDDAEAAIELYTSLFPDARVLQRSDYGPGMPLNGGPGRPHTEAFSFFVTCADQNEVDRYWHGLIAGGGRPSQCGWLVDRFGLSWQIIPQAFLDYASDPDPARVGRVMQAMLQMQKMDVAGLTAAYEG